jgi:hypothetical protein
LRTLAWPPRPEGRDEFQVRGAPAPRSQPTAQTTRAPPRERSNQSAESESVKPESAAADARVRRSRPPHRRVSPKRPATEVADLLWVVRVHEALCRNPQSSQPKLQLPYRSGRETGRAFRESYASAGDRFRAPVSTLTLEEQSPSRLCSADESVPQPCRFQRVSRPILPWALFPFEIPYAPPSLCLQRRSNELSLLRPCAPLSASELVSRVVPSIPPPSRRFPLGRSFVGTPSESVRCAWSSGSIRRPRS